jgi:hypothetical protein
MVPEPLQERSGFNNVHRWSDAWKEPPMRFLLLAAFAPLRRVMTARRAKAAARIDRIASVSPACRRDRVLLVAELLFVAGWSLMWASSLALIPRIPISICLALMIIGLSLPPGYVRWSARDPGGGRP